MHQVLGSPCAWSALWKNENIDIGKSQRLRKDGNARINKVFAMRACLAKTNEKVCISRYVENLETDLQISENTCGIDYADTWLSKPVHWLSTSDSPHLSTTYSGFEQMMELNTGVAWASIPIMRIHSQLVPESKTQWLPAALHNPGSMDPCQVRHESSEAILILDSVDVAEAYSRIASHYHSVQWHIWSHG